MVGGIRQVGDRLQLEVRRRNVLVRPVPRALYARLGDPGAGAHPANKPDGSPLARAGTSKPAWPTVSAASSTWYKGTAATENADANVWVGGEVSNYFRDSYPEAERRLGKVRALRLAGHNTMFLTLSWLNGTQTLRVWHPKGPNCIEVWVFCISDKDAPPRPRSAEEEPRPRLRPGRLPGGRSRELRKCRRCCAATWPRRPGRLCIQMGLGSASAARTAFRASPTTPAETVARGFYRCWVDMMTAESWDELEALTTAYEAELAQEKEAVNA